MVCRAVLDLVGTVDDIVDGVGVEDLEGAVVGFFEASFCLLGGFEDRLVFFLFLGGSLGIFFFSSGIVLIVLIVLTVFGSALKCAIGDCGW